MLSCVGARSCDLIGEASGQPEPVGSAPIQSAATFESNSAPCRLMPLSDSTLPHEPAILPLRQEESKPMFTQASQPMNIDSVSANCGRRAAELMVTPSRQSHFKDPSANLSKDEILGIVESAALLNSQGIQRMDSRLRAIETQAVQYRNRINTTHNRVDQLQQGLHAIEGKLEPEETEESSVPEESKNFAEHPALRLLENAVSRLDERVSHFESETIGFKIIFQNVVSALELRVRTIEAKARGISYDHEAHSSSGIVSFPQDRNNHGWLQDVAAAHCDDAKCEVSTSDASRAAEQAELRKDVQFLKEEFLRRGFGVATEAPPSEETPSPKSEASDIAVAHSKESQVMDKRISGSVVMDKRNAEVDLQRILSNMRNSSLSREVPQEICVGDLSVNRILADLEQKGGITSHDMTVGSWSFQHSIWDAAVLIFDEYTFQLMESMLVLMLLVVNIVTQACFLIIVWNSLATTTLDQDTMDQFHVFRTDIAHSTQFSDKVTQESLATRVCKGDASLELGLAQSRVVKAVEEYLDENFPFNGPLMCVFAMLTWALTVNKEFEIMVNMIGACRDLPRGSTRVAMDDQGRLFLMSVSKARMVILVLLVLCRGTIAILMFLAGAKYLAMTTRVEEIMLNVVSLEFVLSIDELLYLLAPLKTRSLIFLLRPLRRKTLLSFSGVDAHTFATVLTIVIFISVAIVTWMIPEMRRMREAERELCGGNLDFLYSLNIGLVNWASTPTMQGSVLDIFKTKSPVKYHMLRNVIDEPGGRFDNLTVAHRIRFLSGPRWSLESMSLWTMERMGEELNGDCMDFNDLEWPLSSMGWSSLRDTFHNASLTTCADLALHCNHYVAPVMRLWCPNTCKCDEFISSLAVPYPKDGCPISCMRTVEFDTKRGNAPCSEATSNVLIAMPLWQEYVTHWRMVTSDWGNDLDKRYQQVANLMLAHGCDARLPALALSVDICHSTVLRPVSYWCPETCQCNGSFPTAFCPWSCLR